MLFRSHAFVAAGDAGDWSAWADLHTEDCHWVEHHYGTIVGRDAIRAMQVLLSHRATTIRAIRWVTRLPRRS